MGIFNSEDQEKHEKELEIESKRLAKIYTALHESEGWKLFQEYIRTHADILRNKTFTAESTHEMSMNAGAYNAVRFLDQWAKNQAIYYQGKLQK